MSDKAYWDDDGETGPPTPEDDMWFHEHVRVAGYPKPRRDPEPMPGQMSMADEYGNQWLVRP